MWTVKVYYPKVTLIPTNTEIAATSIIPSYLMRNIPLIKTINSIFDGEHTKVFGVNAYIEPGAPESVTLVPDKQF